MPKIPEYVSQQDAFDIGQTPNAGNGGQAIGAGLQALGGGLQEAGDAAIEVNKENAYRLQLRQQKQTAFDDNAKWDLYRAQSANALKQAADNMPAEATGFAQSFIQSQAKPQADLLASMSPINRDKYQKMLAVENEQTLGSASQLEHAGRATYETNTINTAYQSYLTGIARDPNARDAATADLYQKIDNTSSLSPATKDDMKAKIENGISMAQWQALYGNKPAEGAAALGRRPDGSAAGGEQNTLLAAVAKGESGGDYDKIFADGKWGAPPQPLTSMTLDQAIALANSIRRNPDNPHNAGPVGKYQFVGSTLQGLKGQMGLTGNEQFTPQLQDALAWRNLENTGGDPEKIRQQWTSWAGKSDAEIKQLWSQGLAQHQQFVASGGAGPTGGPAAASASRLTSTAYAPGGSPPAELSVDPRFASLTLDQQNSLIASAQRTQSEQQAAAAKQQKAVTDNLENDLQNALQDGKAGMPEINQARQQGWLSDADKVQKFTEIVDKREKSVANVRNFFDRANTPGAQWNAFDDQQKKEVNAAFQAYGGDVGALEQVYRPSGIVPEGAATVMRSAIFGRDPQQRVQALQVASNIMADNPTALRGVAGGDDIQNASVKYQHYLGLGMSSADATQRIVTEQDPSYKPPVKVTDDDVKTFTNGITPAAVAKQFDTSWLPWTDPRVGVGPGQQDAILGDFREVATDFYKQSGDANLAMAQAKAQLSKVYGVTQALGSSTLMKYPPEKAYPPVPNDTDGGYGYIGRQAAADVKQATGKDVDPSDIVLMAIPRETEPAFARGGPVPYQIGYLAFDTATGQKTFNPVYGQNFVADPAAAHAELLKAGQAQQQQQNDAYRGVYQKQQAERDQLKGLYGNILTNSPPSAVDQQATDLAASNTAKAKAPVITPPATPPAAVPGKPAAPAAGNGAFQQQKDQFGSPAGGDGWGGSGVGM